METTIQNVVEQIENIIKTDTFLQNDKQYYYLIAKCFNYANSYNVKTYTKYKELTDIASRLRHNFLNCKFNNDLKAKFRQVTKQQLLNIDNSDRARKLFYLVVSYTPESNKVDTDFLIFGSVENSLKVA